MPGAFKLLWNICSFSVNRKIRLSCHFLSAEITHLRVRVSEGHIRLPQRCQDEPFNMAVDRCQAGQAVITKGWDRDGSASTALKHKDGNLKRKLGSFSFTLPFYSFLSFLPLLIPSSMATSSASCWTHTTWASEPTLAGLALFPGTKTSMLVHKRKQLDVHNPQMHQHWPLSTHRK